MDDFFKCLTEQACGNVYKKVLNEQNPGAEMNMDQMSQMGDMDQMDDMSDMPTGDEGKSDGIQLTGEQVAMLNQDLQGISQAIQRLQSVLGGDISPMGQNDMGMGDMEGMDGMDDMEQEPLPGGGNVVGPPVNMMSRYMHRR